MIQMYKDVLVKNDLLSGKEILGVSDDDLVVIENKFNVKLPQEYIDFLSIFGCKSGKLFAADYIHYPHVLDFQLSLNEFLVEESIDFELPKNSHVFLDYQGFYFLYFICDGNDDPIVYSFDADNGVEMAYVSFSQFIKLSVLEFFFNKKAKC